MDEQKVVAVSFTHEVEGSLFVLLCIVSVKLYSLLNYKGDDILLAGWLLNTSTAKHSTNHTCGALYTKKHVHYTVPFAE